MANYYLNDDGSTRVNNSCFKKGVYGETIGKAYPNPIDTNRTNAKLLVQFPSSPRPGDYWVVRLDSEYRFSVVGTPNYECLWILSRERNLPQNLYTAIVNDQEADGFPV